MQSPAPVACPECGQVVASGQLDVHLRDTHRLYLFRGVRAPLPATLASLLNALCQLPPDTLAYQLLERIARDEHGPQAADFLASLLELALARVPAGQVPPLCDALAEVVSPRPSAWAVALLLTTRRAMAARRLALTLTARLPAPIHRRLERAVRPLLSDRALPPELQFTVAAALLRHISPRARRAVKLLRAVVKGRSKIKAVARLQQLEQQVGPFAALQDFRSRLEARIRMRCPRCQVEMPRHDMVGHLWNEHRLVLDGQRVREPWPVIEDWLAEAGPGGDASILERCRTLAQQLDPERGLHQLQRLIVSRKINDPDARRALLAEAAAHRGSLCPRCYDLVLLPQDPPPRPMSVCRGRLSVAGYRVEVENRGLWRWAEVEVPGQGCLRMVPPGPFCTRQSALLFLVAPLVLVALLMAIFGPTDRPLLPVGTLLLLALVLWLVVRLRWGPQRSADDRAIDFAWTWLAPRLHGEGFSLEDSAFLASLSLASLRRGWPRARHAALERLLSLTERVVRMGFGGAHHLAALRRLALGDAVRREHDHVRLVAAEVDRCFRGELPLAYVDGLLDPATANDWRPGELARMRVLLCESAFEAGFEVRDLVEAGEAAPALGTVVNCKDVQGLAFLRLLWSLRATRPWDRVGEADTVFEIAAQADSHNLLEHYPDLILHRVLPGNLHGQSPARSRNQVPLLLCGRGVVLRGLLISQPPRVIEVHAHSLPGETADHELIVDDQCLLFPSPPDGVALQLERWCRYFFDELSPLVADVPNWPPPDALAVRRAWGAVSCPDCGHLLLPVVGDVGIPLRTPDPD